MNTYEVFSKAMKDGKQWYLTSDRVTARSKEAAAAKIAARGNRIVTGVIFVCTT